MTLNDYFMTLYKLISNTSHVEKLENNNNSIMPQLKAETNVIRLIITCSYVNYNRLFYLPIIPIFSFLVDIATGLLLIECLRRKCFCELCLVSAAKVLIYIFALSVPLPHNILMELCKSVVDYSE